MSSSHISSVFFSLWACLSFPGTWKIRATGWHVFFCHIWVRAAGLSWLVFSRCCTEFFLNHGGLDPPLLCFWELASQGQSLASDLLCLFQLFVSIKSAGPPWRMSYIWEGQHSSPSPCRSCFSFHRHKMPPFWACSSLPTSHPYFNHPLLRSPEVGSRIRGVELALLDGKSITPLQWGQLYLLFSALGLRTAS